MAAPHIDYLAKDFASFKRLLRDRITSLVPGSFEDHPADLGTALIEALSYAADHLSYYQDAVATEAYLGTARQRISVRRHARLLDYYLHEGQNARVLCALEVQKGSPADGATLPRGTQILTRKSGHPVCIHPTEFDASSDAPVFETMHDRVLSSAFNHIALYQPNGQVLPIGTTSCQLENPAVPLAPGDLLIFVETADPETELAVDADPSHRHAVRLQSVRVLTSARTTRHQILEVTWSVEDALPFALDPAYAVALGNVVLCDHGQTLPQSEALSLQPRPLSPAPRLQRGPLTFVAQSRDEQGQQQPFAPRASIASAFTCSPRDACPAIVLSEDEEGAEPWTPQPDLLSSDRFSRHFVVEVDNHSRASLRFGDDILGRRPDTSHTIAARYRIGNGPDGNIGADALQHVVTPLVGIDRVRNPLPALGGTAPESLDEARLHAPVAFRDQQRAVRSEDYAAMAMRHPQVRHALASGRFTGSLFTVILAVQRKGGRPVDAPFVTELRQYLEPYRLIGHDLSIVAPIWVPLDLRITVSIAADYVRNAVQSALLEAFSSTHEHGFFHPDRYMFGEPVYFSRIVHHAMQVPGVRFVSTDPRQTRFARKGQPDALEHGAIALHGLEIPRVDNDPLQPENGRIQFVVQGGL